MAVIDAVYNYFTTTYGNTISSSRYESHKKSELRDVYNKIVKTNKEEPLYKINMNDDMENFVIDLKEGARQTSNIAEFLSSDGEGVKGFLNQKIAVSSDEDLVSVEYIGEGNSKSDGFSIKVNNMAKPQVIVSNFVKKKGRDFEEGNFSFDLDTPDTSYELQFNIGESETNQDILTKISRLINRSDIGIKSEVIDNESESKADKSGGEKEKGDSCALKISSEQTGLADDEEFLFRIQSGSSWNEIHKLGLDNITSPAKSASFLLNGKEHKALSNIFTINNEFEIRLKKVSEKEVKVGFKANADAIGDSVGKLLRAYNGLLGLGEKYGERNGYNRLRNEVTAIWNTFSEDLQNVGVLADEKGKLKIDKDILSKAIMAGKDKDTFEVLDKFKNSMAREAEKISLNPMMYVDKRVVEYKNPGKTFTAPYTLSRYAGLIVDELL